MGTILENLKLIFLNFKLTPKKAFRNSYQAANSNETSVALIILLALITGISNVLGSKYLPIKIMGNIDNTLSNYKMGGIGDYFKNNYKPNLGEYFLIGVVLFFIVLLICSIVSYAARTNLFKTSDNFITILKTTALSLIPAVILLMIANIMVSFSLILYLLFVSLSSAAFVIYFYEHLSNITTNSKDTLCFVCSISLVIILFIAFRLNINKDILTSITNPFGNFLNGGVNNLFNYFNSAE